MKRYILTGAPGAGKTSILRALESMGYAVAEEAATDVIAIEHRRGIEEPWTDPSFLEKILAVQLQRQEERIDPPAPVQVFDRSPVCTLALARWLGLTTPAVVRDALIRLDEERTYERKVFFIRPIGFVEPTAARRINFEDSVRFERVHEEVYQELGYQLIDVPAGPVVERAGLVDKLIRRWS